MTKVALYARVSTLLGQDPELQMIQLRDVAKARGYEITGEYVDRGISGKRESRPALNELLKAINHGKCKIVMVSALDRIGRSTKHILQLMEDFKARNVSLISLRESLDFTTPTGQMVLTVLAAVATLEAQIISERIRVSLASKKVLAQNTGNGWRCGRPPVVNKDISEKVRRLRAGGLSIRGTAREAGISKTSVERILRGRR